MSIYGKYNADGSVTEPTECAVSGDAFPRRITGSVRFGVGGDYFVRYYGKHQRRITPELVQQWITGAPKTGSSKKSTEGDNQ